MLKRLVVQAFRSLRGPRYQRRLRRASDKLSRAIGYCRRGDYAPAGTLCETAISLTPELADAHYLSGLLACRGAAADAGARSIERALEFAPENPLYAAALADARLLQQREDDAVALYARAFPDQVAEINGLSDAGLPWKRVHPDWLKGLRHVSLALPGPTSDEGAGGDVIRMNEALPRHLLNWALLLVVRRKVRQAIRLLERAVESDPRLGYAHGTLALLHTLNRDWQAALAAAEAARASGVEVFPGANDLCILAAQFGLGTAICGLDPVFDWSAFDDSASATARHLDLLPALEGTRFLQFAPDSLVYLICCDTDYFMEHAIALACSIREKSSACAIHLHLYNPDAETWSGLDGLAKMLAPLPLSFTWESVDFERYGGKGMYCACARFSRLYQLLGSASNRIVMVDADSLVRADLAPALSGRGQIGLVEAPDEPMWHRYLAGFTTFCRSAAAEQFLGRLGAFLARNLTAGRARLYIDQIGLYASAYHLPQALAGAVDRLPIGQFCDTLFQEGGLVWSVTQGKTDDSAFAQYKRAVLSRYGNLRTE